MSLPDPPSSLSAPVPPSRRSLPAGRQRDLRQLRAGRPRRLQGRACASEPQPWRRARRSAYRGPRQRHQHAVRRRL